MDEDSIGFECCIRYGCTLIPMDCKSVGIDGDALTYLESYLENRHYHVQIERSSFNKKFLNRGVPQGSVLGPVLFCIYTI